MAAPTIAQILAGIETRLQTISRLRTEAYIADQMNFPCAVVGVPPIESYRATFGRGTFQLQPQVFVLVSAALDRVGQAALGSYADVTGTNSIPVAIEGDRTLGGVVSDCVVTAFRPLGMEEVGVIQAYGGVFDLLVVAPGT